MTLFHRVLREPDKYNFNVDTLGECKIDSPARQRDFIAPGSRAVMAYDVAQLTAATQKLNGNLPSFEAAGPMRKIFHDPAWSRAAILTAGGLCPGLNHVIKGLVEILSFDYGIKMIYGIRYGYSGLIPKFGHEPMILTPDVVDTIHEDGGTILGTSRGQQDTGEIVDTLIRMNINLLFCIGGDGTLRGARDIADECRKRKLAISVLGIPKTIDNDLNFVGRSFGFETAVAETVPILRSAHVESKSVKYGIGLVRLMGRDSGFIAAYATVANPIVNICLIPEMAFDINGKNGLLKALERRFACGKDHAVIVVAEGAGQEHIQDEPERRDLSGNVLKKDIGEFLNRTISAHFKKQNCNVAMKYYDPSYSIRSVPAKGTDAIRCYLLARNAVHAAMAGRTNCVIANNAGNSYTVVPTELVCTERNKIDLNSDVWRAVLDATGQLGYFNGDGNYCQVSK
ncbi:MAG: ATP-dependent 6-phosphofructokinase [Lentisphaerae bacterium]|jgi:6-phosphofructokinase 1|nr:ATP-dependent 6-phosphofructokinase [Lentisphaerota bacterium]